MKLTLEQLNAAAPARFAAALAGTYEHTPWIVERAAALRPFSSLAHLKLALVGVVRDADRETQLALIRAHPELAGKAMVAKTMTAESTHEQGKAGLSDCTPEEFARITKLNADYNAKFGFPFILAVRGPRGIGLSRHEIIATFERRLHNHPDFELDECLRNIHRIAELRLDDKFGHVPDLGNRVLDWAEQLAVHSDPGFAERGQLTVTYLTDAHRACGEAARAVDARRLRLRRGRDRRRRQRRRPVSRSRSQRETAADRKPLRHGAQRRQVRRPARHPGADGVRSRAASRGAASAVRLRGRRLRGGGRPALQGRVPGLRRAHRALRSAWLDQKDADGVTMRDAMAHAGLRVRPDRTARARPSRYCGVRRSPHRAGPGAERARPAAGHRHVDQRKRPLRRRGDRHGEPCRHDADGPPARCGGRRRRADPLRREARAALRDVVGTVGMLEVPSGSINVIPGRCKFSLDLRATTNQARDACVGDVLAELQSICERRGVAFKLEETVRAAAAPSAPAWQKRWERAVEQLGLPVHRLPSGAGHDAMKLHEIMPQAMLFTRGMNAGISHNPLEAITNDDADLTVRAFQHLLDDLSRQS